MGKDKLDAFGPDTDWARERVDENRRFTRQICLEFALKYAVQGASTEQILDAARLFETYMMEGTAQ